MQTAVMPAILYYVHDPMCSWCWGFAPAWQRIRALLPPDIQVVYLLGGLAPDTDEPMPADMRASLQQTWHTIQARLGTPFNFEFWSRCQPRRATYPACRAVIAATAQNAGENMIEAIQHAYYLRAMNPSDDATLCQLADELDLEVDRFAADLAHPDSATKLQRQIHQARQLGADSFPSLVYVTGNRPPQHIQHDYRDPQITLARILEQHDNHVAGSMDR